MSEWGYIIIGLWGLGWLAAVLLLAVFWLQFKGGRPFTDSEWMWLFLGAAFWPFVLLRVVVRR